MTFYHVLITTSDQPDSFRCVLSDLSEENLMQQFLRPYQRGKSILCGDEIVESLQIKRLKVVKTVAQREKELEKLQEESFRKIQEFNRSSDSITIVSPGRGYNVEDIVEVGEDVTIQFVSAPPGEGDRWKIVADLLNNGWVVGIGGGLIVAVLVWWLGWS